MDIDIDIASHKKERAFEVVQRKLRELGGPYDIVGRLLTSDESSALSSSIKGTFSYWTGSIIDGGEISNVNPGNIYYGSHWCGYVFGVRPVIEVSTSDMPS